MTTDAKSSGNLRRTIWILILLVLAGVLATRVVKPPVFTLRGAVVTADRDALRQSPIADVEISANEGILQSSARSGFSGGFVLKLRPRVPMGTRILLKFRHPGYQPLDIPGVVEDRLYVAHMIPLHAPTAATSNVAISNVSIRYSVETSTVENIGTGVHVFEVRNSGGKPCPVKSPCSPDGRWMAAIATASLDAGDGNEFRNARVSCLAGPCPFSKVQTDHFSAGGRNISVSILNWSDTTTFLLQAEVFRLGVGDVVRTHRPVILGRALHFSLPSAAQGPSILAELNGEAIVFPLSADAGLSWSNCEFQVEKAGAKSYRCELKPGYEFR
jgi:hypothetical protein